MGKSHKLYALLIDLSLHPNDVGFLAVNYALLQKFDQYIRWNRKEQTTTTFENKETRIKLEKEIENSCDLKLQLQAIRRSKKMNFWMNRGTTKLSSIHSFKGWEIQNLVLLIEKDTKVNEDGESVHMDELIYTGITRCRNRLFILNFGNQVYHEFFMEHKNLFDQFENTW